MTRRDKLGSLAIFQNHAKSGYRALGGEALRNYSAFWAAGWPQSAKRPSSNVSEHVSPSLPGEPTESARPAPKRKRPELDGASCQPSFAEIKFPHNRPNQRTNLFRSRPGNRSRLQSPIRVAFG